MRAIWNQLGAAIAGLFMSGVYLAAFMLRPWRLGRLLGSVSIPRMQEHRLRTVLTTLGIALGVALLVAVLTVNRSIVRGVTHTIDDLAGKVDLQVGAAAGMSGFDENLLEVARDVPGVYKVTPSLQQIVTLHTSRGGRERLLVLGVDLVGSEDAHFREYASGELEEIRRNPLPFLNSRSNLILSRNVAQRLGLRLHDKVALAGPSGIQEFEVWGFIESKGVGRAFGGAVGVMDYAAMQLAFERGRNIDRIDVAVKPGANPETVARALEAKLGRGLGVERPALRGERVDKMLRTVKTTLMMSSFIALIAGAFVVFNTISIGIVQRKRELGILRALGTTRNQLARLLTLEGALLGVVGSAWGVVIGLAISKSMLRVTSDAVNRVYLQQRVTDVSLDARLVALGFALGLGTAIVAAWFATQRATGLRPVDALSSRVGPSASDASQTGIQRSDVAGIGLLLLSAALVQIPPLDNLPIGALAAAVTLTLAGRALMPRLVRVVYRGLRFLENRALTVEAALASHNLPRDVSRTSSTAAGLMAGVALTLAIATFIVSFITSLDLWMDQAVTGDLFVTSGESVSSMSSSNTAMSSALSAKLAAIPGVQRLRPIRFVDVGFRGATVKILSTDIRIFLERGKFTPVEGTTSEISSGLLRGNVVVSENFAKLFGLHRGDKLTLPAKAGERTFEIAGVVIDYTSDRGAIVMDRETYISTWQDDRVDTFEVHVAPGTAPERVRGLINERLSERHDLFVLTNREFQGEFVEAISQIFSLMNVLEVVTLLVAALGMLTALLANVLDRVRELGVLRAVGMLRIQVRRMVLIEATFVGAVGTLAGIGVGLALGYLMLRHITQAQLGWHLPYHLPLRSMLQLVLVTLPLSALAGYLPARLASRLVVKDALNYE